MYRVSLRLAVCAAAVSMNIHAAVAEQIAAAQAVRLETAAGIPLAQLPIGLGPALDARLGILVHAETDQQQRAWLAQLKSFYASRTGTPVWVTNKGYTEPALRLVGVLANARDYGLNPALIAIPDLPPDNPSQEQLSEAEIAMSRAVVAYAFQARGGRIEPSELSLWLDRTPDPIYASAVMIEMISAKDQPLALQQMNPQSPAFELLRRAYVAKLQELRSPKPRQAQDFLPNGPRVVEGQRHPDVAKLRTRLASPAKPGNEDLFDDAFGDALADYMANQGLRIKWGYIDDRIRAVFNRPPEPPTMGDALRLLANMERWRWLPRDLGQMYIWNNLPEQMTRVFKDGEIVHEERIIVGQPDTQTPVFSETMKAVVFQPEWGVPPSIKINELLPKLQDGDYAVLDRRDMRILRGDDEVDPQDLHWDRIDIRQVGIYQRAGDNNPLGQVKFLFPNRHHVYMHDTNARSLFSAKERYFSHGCIRVRDPERLANIVLNRDKGWDEKKVHAAMYNWDVSNNKIELSKPIPVHNVYFTFVPGSNGELIELEDRYGHDKRVGDALSGVPAAKIAEDDPARNQLQELEDSAPPAAQTKPMFGPQGKS